MQTMSIRGAARAARLTLVLAAAAAAFGCATGDGAGFLAAAQKEGAPKGGLARVYIYPAGRPPTVTVALDGQLIGELVPGTYLRRDIPAGGHELISEAPTYPGVTRFTFSVASGHTHYLMAEPSAGAKSTQTATTWGYVFGLVPAVATNIAFSAANAGKGGPVNFVSVPETTAAQALAGLSAR